ncbi:ferritin-like domain-containing protein [Chitinophaga solisilvae]|uniref:ferritin-like domain-containing protein n=1 Tax=Chitinophaga solisilvae TaxID=1233460 RepID=UPI00137134A1|nr:PA2169 family four-helix-bundle protein [Chitinophaga solisilvae]
MEQQEMLAEVLQDLVKINNDRVEGYEKAKEATDDADLKALFQRMIDDSEHYASQLNAELVSMGEPVKSGTTTAGKLYRAWMDMKIIFTGHNRYAILSSCEYGEDAAQRAYYTTLRSDTGMPYSMREMIANQQISLRNAHDTIKTYRDLAAVVHS